VLAITKEWVSAGAGALISGALAVVLVQAAIVTKPGDSSELEQARETALQESATGTEAVLASEAQPRLLLPGTTSEPRGSSEGADPGQVVHTDHLKVAGGKDTLRAPGGHLSGAQGRVVAERDSGKSVQSRQVVDDVSAQPDEQATGELSSRLQPRYRPDTTPVNAGFEGPELRSVGEDLSWNVHSVFQNTDGPMPFFYVDDDTKTLMFGFGWRH
jgi:hypothetical protein